MGWVCCMEGMVLLRGRRSDFGGVGGGGGRAVHMSDVLNNVSTIHPSICTPHLFGAFVCRFDTNPKSHAKQARRWLITCRIELTN